MSYYNTTNLQGVELIKADFLAVAQERMILEFYKLKIDANYTPFEVWHLLFSKKTPITSIRRAITDLTEKDYLVKTGIQRKGDYGKLCYAWRLKEKKPLPQINAK